MADYFLSDTVMDVSLQYLKDNCDKITLCSAEPTTYTQANTTFKLSETGALVSGDFTLADGAVDGRKVTVGAKSALAVSANGTITHAAWVKTGTSALLAVTKLTTARAVTTADTVNMPAHFVALRDAVVAS